MYETHDKRALLLPNVTSADAGKVLAVDENGKLSLEEMGSGLPEVSTADAGRVLTVSEDGEWEAAAPSGGLALYGPYFAKNNSQASVGTTGTYISLDKIFNLDENEVIGNNEAFYLMDGFNLAVIGVDTKAVSPYSVFATSLTGSSVTVGQFDCTVSFYSTIELQPATP